MTGRPIDPIEPAEFENSPEAKELARILGELLARRTQTARQPRRRVIAEQAIAEALHVTFKRLGIRETSGLAAKLWDVQIQILAYTLAEWLGASWQRAYDLGYRVGACEPEPTLRTAALAIFGPGAEPWPTVEAFVEFYREHLAPGTPRVVGYTTAGAP